MGTYETLELETDENGLATLWLNRPDRLNAFTEQMMHDLIAAFDETDADDAVRAVIVTGRGRGFCAGADLGSGGKTFDYDARGAETTGGVHRDGGGRVTLRVFQSLKPVLAAVNGPAVGVGASLQLPMDARLASTSAKIGFVFARRGIVPDAAASWFLPKIVGVPTALEWAYSGRVFSAQEALERGLVRSLHEPDELLPAAKELALSMVSESAPVSVSLTRQMIWRMAGAPHPMDAHKIDSRAIHSRGASGDAKEGVTSFLEKRAAHFPDKVSTDLPDPFSATWPDPEFS